jgi:integrase
MTHHDPSIREIIRHRSVSITIYPLTNRPGYWQFQFRDTDGKTRKITRSTVEDAREAARQTAKRIQSGTTRLDDLTPDQLRIVARLLAVNPSLAEVDEFLAWRHRARPVTPTGDVVAAFLAAKTSAAGRSPHNVRTLTRHLSLLDGLAARPLSEITAADLAPLLPVEHQRTTRNVRASWVTLWRWARRNGHIPDDSSATAPERLERPAIERPIPSTWEPAELRVLLRETSPKYRPWLALAAFAGIRTEEVCPDQHGTKSPLDWSDFHWDRMLIIVRPETAKMKHRRVVPILPALAAWLEPFSAESGPVGPSLPPHQPAAGGRESETTRLGKFVGGWKRNALRHSFISYRAAIVGLAQTAMEAGNSESEARRSYNDAKGADTAAEWFAEFPKVSASP